MSGGDRPGAPEGGAQEPDGEAPAPQSVPEPQNEPAPEAELETAGLSAPREGATTLAEADAAPGSPAEEVAEAHAEKDEGVGKGSAAAFVAAGILASRVMGLVREKAVAYYFGVGAHLDVFQLVMRGANLLNNLLGEGTLSASFIPIYSRMLEEGRAREAGRFAGAVLGLVAAAAGLAAILGIVFAEAAVTVIAPGFLGDAEAVAAGEIEVDRFPLAVAMFRIALPMSGFLALSAWALGVLNSHRRFFLPYVAPTVMNLATVTALVWAATGLFESPFELGALDVIPVETLNRLLFAGVVGAFVGGLLQFGVQLPLVFRLTTGLRLSLSTKVKGVREAISAFGPVVAGRGVAQVSSYIDTILAGLATAGTLGALRPALVLYLLPISLFGMSVAASELPELSRISQDRLAAFLARVERSMRQVLYLVLPTAVVYVGFGGLIVGSLFGGGAFNEEDVALVALILGGYALGIAATAVSRLLQNSFYALSDTKTPAKVAVVRVVVSGVIGAGLMFWLDQYPVSALADVAAEGRPLTLAAVGLSLGASAGAWVELGALAWALRRRTPDFRLPLARALQMLGLAGLASVPAVAVYAFVPDWPVLVRTVLVLGAFGVTYLGAGALLGFSEGDAWIGRFLKRRG